MEENFKLKVTAGAGGGGGGGHTPVEDPDSLQSRAMVSIIDLLGEGQVGGLVNGAKSIFFNGTPLENDDGTRNFQGVSYEFRDGQQIQAPLAGFPDTETPTVVNVKVTKNSPSVVTITNALADAVRLIVTVPALVYQDPNNGDTHGSEVWFKFEISVNNGAYYPLSGDLVISGKTRSRYQRAYYYNLPKTAPGGGAASRWSIRMTRLSADSATATVQNDIYFDSFYEILNTRMTYPNSAIIGVKIDSQQFSSIPDRYYLIDGLIIKVPSNYDPVTRTYSGVWNGTFKLAVSNNPAWVLYDVLLSKRYGLGQYLSQSNVDAAKLYAIGKYCDELVPDGFGGTEPRFVINTSINSRVEAYRLITDLCSAFNGMGFWSGSQVQFTQDAPSDPVMLFTPANVVGGLFQYAGSSRKDRHSVALVKWNDPKQNYKQMVEYVEDSAAIARYGVRKLDTIAFGCTSRGQAARCGRWLLYTEQYQSDMVQFTVGLDAALVLPGDVIKIHDTVRAGKRMGGRLKSCTLTSAVLDSPVTLSGGALATISIRLPDGTFAERKIKESGVAVTLSEVSWQDPLPALPVDYAMWIVADSAVSPMLARVVGVSQGENRGELAITAIEHNPSKYDAVEKGLKLESVKTSIVTTAMAAQPKNMVFSEVPYFIGPGLAGISLDVSWTGNAPNYEVSWKRDGKYATNWQTLMTSMPSIELENVRAGTYQFSIVAISGFGVRSAPVETTYTTVGKTSAPGDVLNFKVTKRTTDLLLTWDVPTGTPVRGYEIRVGSSWDSGLLVIANFAGTMLVHDQDYPGVYTYHIRSISQDGTYCDNVSSFALTLNAPATPTGFDFVQSGSRLELHWQPNAEVDLAYYELREGSSWATGSMIAQTRSTSISIPSGSIGSRQFWLKAVVAPGVYSEASAWLNAAVVTSPSTNVVVSDNERAIGWTGAKIGLTIDNYAMRMVPGVTRAEYTFPISLGQSYRAQNSLYAQVSSIINATDTTTWNDATWPWSSDQALRHWIPSGNPDSIANYFDISVKSTLGAADYDGWRLSDALSSVLGKAVTTSTGATFEGGRFTSGLRLKPGVVVDWQSLSIPSSFKQSFWLAPKAIDAANDNAIMSWTNGTSKMNLIYAGASSSFKLIGSDGVTVTVPMATAVGDSLAIMVVQTATQRKLFVGKVGGATMSASASAAPIASFVAMRLYWS